MIERRHLREQLEEVIRDRIVRQTLPANQSVGEIALAAELGVSRTPVRETLLGLQRDGFVKAIPGRGFVVLPLDADEPNQLYPIVWSLETLAIGELAAVPSEAVARLRAINARLACASSAEERRQCDSDWHRCLVSISGNTRLLAIIESVKASIARYEHAFLDASDRRDNSVGQHEQIASLLEHSPARAAEALERHWRQGLAVVREAIGAR